MLLMLLMLSCAADEEVPRVCITRGDGRCMRNVTNFWTSNNIMGVGVNALKRDGRVKLAEHPGMGTWSTALARRMYTPGKRPNASSACDIMRKQTLLGCARLVPELMNELPKQWKLNPPLSASQLNALPTAPGVWVLKNCDVHLSRGLAFRRGALADIIVAEMAGSASSSQSGAMCPSGSGKCIGRIPRCIVGQEALNGSIYSRANQAITDWRIHLLLIPVLGRLRGFVHRPSSYVDLTAPLGAAAVSDLRSRYISCQMSQVQRGDDLGERDAFSCVEKTPSWLHPLWPRIERTLALLIAADNTHDARADVSSRLQLIGCDFHVDAKLVPRLIECNAGAGHNWARRFKQVGELPGIAHSALLVAQTGKPQGDWTALGRQALDAVAT